MPSQQKRRSRQVDDGIMAWLVHAATNWVLNHVPLVLLVITVWSFAGYGLGGLSFAGYLVFTSLAVAAKFGIDYLVFSIRQRHFHADVARKPPPFKVLRKKFHEERDRRSTIRKQWVVACQRYDITDPDKMVPRLRRLRPDLAGDFHCYVHPARMVLKNGIEQVELSAKKIAQAVDCRDLVVRRQANGFDLTFMWSDPLDGLLKVADCPKVTGPGFLAFGRTVTGAVAQIEMKLHFLVVGMTRKGKSSTLHTLIADAQRQGIRLNLSIIDPKGGVELHDYEAHKDVLNGTLLIRDYCGDTGSSVETLLAVVNRLRERQAEFKRRGLREWLPSMVDEFPLEVLLVDECLIVLNRWMRSKMGKDTAQGGAMAMFCNELLAQGAGFGFVFWGLSQTGKVEALGPARDQIPQRFCLGVANAQEAAMALGEHTPGIERAVGLEKGRGLLWQEHEEALVEVRVAFCDKADVRVIAAGRAQSLFRLPKNDIERLCYVYLLRDRFWRAVYVGKGFVPEGRIGHHLAGTGQLTATEAQIVDESKTDVFTCPNEAAALAWEKELIHRCRPMANKVHNTRNPSKDRVPTVAPWDERPPEPERVAVRVPLTRRGRRRATAQAVEPDRRPEPVSAPAAYVVPGDRRAAALTHYGVSR